MSRARWFETWASDGERLGKVAEPLSWYQEIQSLAFAKRGADGVEPGGNLVIKSLPRCQNNGLDLAAGNLVGDLDRLQSKLHGSKGHNKVCKW